MYSLTAQEARDLKSRCPREALRKTPSSPLPVIPVAAGIPWRSVEFGGVPWCCIVSCGVPWHCVALCGIPWRSVQFAGISWCSMALCDVPWRPVAFCGVPWLVATTPISACDFPWPSSLCVSSPLLMRVSLLGFRPP